MNTRSILKFSYYAHLYENEHVSNQLEKARKENRMFLPRYLHFWVTYRCNSRCMMCDCWKRRPEKELSVKEWERIFSSPLFSKLRLIKFTGGECFERNDFVELFAMIAHRFPEAKISIASNGFPAERIKNTLQELLKIRDEFEISFSLDGMGEMHDRIRGVRNAFTEVKRSMDHVLWLRSQGHKINLRLSFMITPTNIDEFMKVKEYAKKHRLYLGYRLADIGELYNRKECPINYDERADNILTELKKNKDNPFKANLAGWFLEKKKPFECYALFSTVFLDPQGRLSTCIKRGKIASIVRHNPLKVWESLSKERAKIKDCKECYTDCQLIPDLIMTGKARLE